jgi:hypothetical protein
MLGLLQYEQRTHRARALSGQQRVYKLILAHIGHISWLRKEAAQYVVHA